MKKHTRFCFSHYSITYSCNTNVVIVIENNARNLHYTGFSVMNFFLYSGPPRRWTGVGGALIICCMPLVGTSWSCLELNRFCNFSSFNQTYVWLKNYSEFASFGFQVHKYCSAAEASLPYLFLELQCTDVLLTNSTFQKAPYKCTPFQKYMKD